MRKVLVVSDSAALCETVDIVLGDQFHVEGLPSQYAGGVPPRDVALVVLDADALIPGGEAPLICIGDTKFRAIPAWRKRLYLPESFDALSLREAAAMLAAPAPAISRAPAPFLAAPFLPAAAMEVATRAASSALPALIWGEAGIGKLRLAQALHAERGAAAFVTLAAAEINAGALPLDFSAAGGETTVVVSGAESLDVTGQRRLVAALAEGWSERPDPLRLVVTSRVDPAQLTHQGKLERDLFYRLGVFTVHLPPLRDRAEDIPELVRTVANGLHSRLGLPAVSFTDAAMRRLSRYLWFGNLAELEAVVARSIVFAGSPVLDAKDLRFGYGSAPATGSVGGATARPAATRQPGDKPPRPESNGVAMDLVIQELAHEFKNPMVTIKTFAHQIDHMLERGEGHEEFARLTGEAVERMDAALENLVQYTRFETPARQRASLGSLVTAALSSVREVVAEKQLALEIEPTSAQVFVDPAQCGYALKNLLRTVARDLSPGDALAVRSVGQSALAIEYPARALAAATALSKLVSGGDGNGKGSLPLGFTFARALIERNGGRLSLDRDGAVARVSVELPLSGDGKGENGQTEGTGR